MKDKLLELGFKIYASCACKELEYSDQKIIVYFEEDLIKSIELKSNIRFYSALYENKKQIEEVDNILKQLMPFIEN